MIQIVDNFLDKKTFAKISSTVLDSKFPWFYLENVTDSSDKHDRKRFGFYHMFYSYDKKTNKATASEFFEDIESSLEQFKNICDISNILKIRADMTVYSSKKILNDGHLDNNEPHLAAVLYLTDSTSETVFFENNLCNKIVTTVLPKQNRMVIFNGDLWHSGYSPKHESRRALINYNFQVN